MEPKKLDVLREIENMTFEVEEYDSDNWIVQFDPNSDRDMGVLGTNARFCAYNPTTQMLRIRTSVMDNVHGQELLFEIKFYDMDNARFHLRLAPHYAV